MHIKFTYHHPSLIPRPHLKNQERGLVAFACIFCRPLPLKILRNQSDCRMKPRGMSSRHMHTRPKVPTMQYGRVARDASSTFPTYVWQWCRVYRRSVDNRNRGALFTHTGYPDKLPDRLSWVPIN